MRQIHRRTGEDGGMPRRRAASLPSDAEAARDFLLQAAESCFERYGITRTTMDDIAEAAQVSRPTLYRYFGDRDSLLRVIAGRRAEMVQAKTTAFLEKQRTLSDKLVEGLLYLAAVGRKDQFYALLVSPETLTLASELLLEDHSAALRFAEAVWGPVLAGAADSGKLRPGLDLDAAFHWLVAVNITLVSWAKPDKKTLEQHRDMLRTFVVPAFLP